MEPFPVDTFPFEALENGDALLQDTVSAHVESDHSSESYEGDATDRDEMRKHRNRQSAAMSRKRKRQELEALTQRCLQLEGLLRAALEENKILRDVVADGHVVSAAMPRDHEAEAAECPVGDDDDHALARFLDVVA